jgi:hypothetical protein
VALIYSLLPDLDSPISSAANFTKRFCLFGFLLGGVCFWYFQNFAVGVFAAICLIVIIVQAVVSHRTWVHTIPAAVLLSLPLLYFGWGWFLSAFGGYSVHLIMDGCFRLSYKPASIG